MLNYQFDPELCCERVVSCDVQSLCFMHVPVEGPVFSSHVVSGCLFRSTQWADYSIFGTLFTYVFFGGDITAKCLQISQDTALA